MGSWENVSSPFIAGFRASAKWFHRTSAEAITRTHTHTSRFKWTGKIALADDGSGMDVSRESDNEKKTEQKQLSIYISQLESVECGVCVYGHRTQNRWAIFVCLGIVVRDAMRCLCKCQSTPLVLRQAAPRRTARSHAMPSRAHTNWKQTNCLRVCSFFLFFFIRTEFIAVPPFHSLNLFVAACCVACLSAAAHRPNMNLLQAKHQSVLWARRDSNNSFVAR